MCDEDKMQAEWFPSRHQLSAGKRHSAPATDLSFITGSLSSVWVRLTNRDQVKNGNRPPMQQSRCPARLLIPQYFKTGQTLHSKPEGKSAVLFSLDFFLLFFFFQSTVFISCALPCRCQLLLVTFFFVPVWRKRLLGNIELPDPNNCQPRGFI